jgi:hypothetical protein
MEVKMKKTICIMAALLMVGSFFAASAMAGQITPPATTGQCSVCPTGLLTPDFPDEYVDMYGNPWAAGYVGYIDRGCETLVQNQVPKGPFDFEDFGSCESVLPTTNSYCASAGKGDALYHKALFELCVCKTNGVWPRYPQTGDQINISMEILVAKPDGTIYNGDNGVYWAENVGTIGIGARLAKDSATTICNITNRCIPADHPGTVYDHFVGPYSYTDEFGAPVANLMTGRSVKLYPNGPGLTISNALAGSRELWVWTDIPQMRVDPNKVTRGDRIYVQVCAFLMEQGGKDPLCEFCCCLIPIGDLCCPLPDVTPGIMGHLIYPYFTAMDHPTWWSGMTITNITDSAGDAMITLYENDGDVGEATVSIPARSNKILSTNDLKNLLTVTTSGELGDSPYYIEVVSEDVMITGFGMMGKASTGESMGYLPINKYGSKLEH